MCPPITNVAQIKKLVCEVFEVEPAQLSPTIMFVEELGVESLAAVELLTVLESEFAIEIEDDDVARMVNVDAVYDRAVAAGAVSLLPPADQPFGDRIAVLQDPFGNNWKNPAQRLVSATRERMRPGENKMSDSESFRSSLHRLVRPERTGRHVTA